MKQGNSLLNGELNELSEEEVKINDWVKVIYEGEIFLGKVQKIVKGQFEVRCLNLPFGIRKYQDLEKETDAVFYKKVYSNDNCIPKLQKCGRGWRYLY